MAFCQAIEQIAEVEVPEAAGLVRVIHAELERVANHLDSTIRHTEAAGQAVAYARLSLHKERVQRLRGRLCGSRFGRGVVVPGGVDGPPRLGAAETSSRRSTQIERGIRADLRLLIGDPLVRRPAPRHGRDPARAGAPPTPRLGPVGRGSGQMEDVRFARPYAAYGRLGHQLLEPRTEGDALARQRVRNDEIAGAFHLIRQAIDRLDEPWADPTSGSRPVERGQTARRSGGPRRPRARCSTSSQSRTGAWSGSSPARRRSTTWRSSTPPSPRTFSTDFAFIEASFGLSIAGVAS